MHFPFTGSLRPRALPSSQDLPSVHQGRQGRQGPTGEGPPSSRVPGFQGLTPSIPTSLASILHRGHIPHPTRPLLQVRGSLPLGWTSGSVGYLRLGVSLRRRLCNSFIRVSLWPVFALCPEASFLPFSFLPYYAALRRPLYGCTPPPLRSTRHLTGKVGWTFGSPLYGRRSTLLDGGGPPAGWAYAHS